jgi:hypothetical protein
MESKGLDLGRYKMGLIGGIRFRVFGLELQVWSCRFLVFCNILSKANSGFFSIPSNGHTVQALAPFKSFVSKFVVLS